MSMNCHRKTRKGSRTSERGAVAVEFVFLFPLFLLILAGLVEMGHMWYVQHAITNACREGARAAIVYRVGNDGVTRECGAAVSNRAAATVNSYLQNALPSGYQWTVTVTPNPLNDCSPGAPLTVRVRADRYLLILDKLIEAFTSANQLEAVSTMRLE
jgi:Flp pilus assembly protein TadG